MRLNVTPWMVEIDILHKVYTLTERSNGVYNWGSVTGRYRNKIAVRLVKRGMLIDLLRDNKRSDVKTPPGDSLFLYRLTNIGYAVLEAFNSEEYPRPSYLGVTKTWATMRPGPT